MFSTCLSILDTKRKRSPVRLRTKTPYAPYGRIFTFMKNDVALASAGSAKIVTLPSTGIPNANDTFAAEYSPSTSVAPSRAKTSVRFADDVPAPTVTPSI